MSDPVPSPADLDHALYDDIYSEISEWDRSDDTYDEVVDAKRDLTSAILRHVSAAVVSLTEHAGTLAAENERLTIKAGQSMQDAVAWRAVAQNRSVTDLVDRASAAEAAAERNRAAYEAKIQDFAAETQRSARMLSSCREVLARIEGGRPPRGERQIALQEGMRMVADEMLRLYQLDTSAVPAHKETPNGS